MKCEGSVCKRRHDNGTGHSWRYENSGGCIECRKVYDRSPPKRAYDKVRQSSPEDLARRKVYNASPKGQFYQYRARAKKNCLVFNLTREEFSQLTDSPCVYCDNFFNNKPHGGLDRIDNAQGYTASNVVPCCWFCNKLKGSQFTYAETLAMIHVLVLLRKKVC